MIYQLGSAIDLFIHPGEYQFADENFVIRTTLGSCVSVSIWHPERKLGGMCHFMLPGRKRPAGEPLNGRYADEALDLLLRKAAEYDTRPEDYEVKLFGGGNMFPAHAAKGMSVSSRNIDAVRNLIARMGLQVKAESLGASGYRNVILHIATGDVWVRHVETGKPAKTARRHFGKAG